jgi:hypothetical protein
MKTLAIVLIIVAILGIVISVFPNFGVRNSVGNRQFNGTRQFNDTQQNFNPNSPAFGFSQILSYAHLGLWVIVLIIAALLMREPKKTKS